ncbi:MAG: class I tRNA ligase family protein, partial [bacterium]
EMEEYKFYLVAEKLYHYTWHEFADIIIERCKKNILEGNNSESAKKLLMTILPIILKTLHPFMPFVTEELWSLLPDTKGRMLMVEKWPC